MGFLDTVFGKVLAVFFTSMVPVLELRGAIIYGQGVGLDWWIVLMVSVVGNMIPVPFIILFIRKIFEIMRKWSSKLDKLVLYFENKAEKHRTTVEKSKFWGLLILVAIPLPGTGAWTGALVAAMMGMRLKDAIPAIFLGVVAAGIVVTLAAAGFISFI